MSYTICQQKANVKVLFVPERLACQKKDQWFKDGESGYVADKKEIITVRVELRRFILAFRSQAWTAKAERLSMFCSSILPARECSE